MNDAREFWNERFGRDGFFYGMNPNVYLKKQLDALSGNQNLLFLGEGEGRNALYAARLGHTVTALDASEIGLAKTALLAQQHNLEIALVHTDLEYWEPHNNYDAIMCSFLHLIEPLRSEIFAKTIHHLRPGGIFAGEFFSIHQLPRTTGGPKDEALLYTADDLQNIVEQLPCDIVELIELDTELYEGTGHNGLASVVRLTVKKQ